MKLVSRPNDVKKTEYTSRGIDFDGTSIYCKLGNSRYLSRSIFNSRSVFPVGLNHEI